VGSVSLGSKAAIAEARIWRKRYGAGMRQIGLLAAAADYALDNNIARMADDHARAKKMAIALAAHDATLINPDHVETNIVGLDLTHAGITAADFAARCKENGLWLSALGKSYARLVTHLDFDDAQCDEAIAIMTKMLG
jgi:threonine aldolase